MAIIDQFGYPASTPTRFAHAADRSRLRGPQYEIRDIDVDKLIPTHDRRALVSMSKRLFTNVGVPKAILTQKADYSVGDAYVPSYSGNDVANGDAAEDWLQNVWMKNCDVRGGIHDWNQYLNDASKDIDFGDSFTLLTYTDDESFPLIQNIPSYRIGSASEEWEGKVKGGRYAGAKIKDGIIYNRQNRPIAYRLLDENEPYGTWQDIPASSIVHVYDPDFSEQGRGIPSLTHAIEDLKHCLQSTEFERIRQLIISSIGIIEYNETGGPDLDDPMNALGAAGTPEEGLSLQAYQGGMIRYMKANSGEKLEAIKHDNPGDVWEAFQDRMIRMSVIGASWSYGMVWKAAGQGTAERADILRARRAVAKRQRLLDHLARRITSYAVAYAQERGKITRANGSIVRLDNPTRWAFSKPPRLTVDDGREATAMRDDYRLGRLNMSDLVEADGKTYETHLAKRIDEVVKMKLAIKAANEANPGIMIEDREVIMRNPNEMAATPAQPAPMEQPDPNSDDEDSPN